MPGTHAAIVPAIQLHDFEGLPCEHVGIALSPFLFPCSVRVDRDFRGVLERTPARLMKAAQFRALIKNFVLYKRGGVLDGEKSVVINVYGMSYAGR